MKDTLNYLGNQLHVQSEREKLFKSDFDQDNYLKDLERDFIIRSGSENYDEAINKVNKAERAFLKARSKWACISAETQRAKKTYPGITYNLKIYDQCLSLIPVYNRQRPLPIPDNSGNSIQRFSKRSRQRLISKARKLDKSKIKVKIEGQRVKKEIPLPLPYFVTLTYRQNYKECKRSKDHLNAFFQHFRRLDPNFNYVWKMEPQKRGAIHYHLAVFISDSALKRIKNKNRGISQAYNLESNTLNSLRLEIQSVWARVTAEIDGISTRYTKFDYIRKTKKKEFYTIHSSGREVETVCRNPKVQYKRDPDIYHMLYGTNVRPVENWKMFLGYIYKYMEKEVAADPFGPDKETGRFWGFSYSLVFDHLYEVIIDHNDLEMINRFANIINNESFYILTDHLIDNVKRLKDSGKSKQEINYKLNKWRNTWKKQKARHIFNKDKLLNGRMFQAEINHVISEEYLNYLTCNKYFYAS